MKIKKQLLALALCFSVSLGCVTPAFADGSSVVTLGADLSEEQKQTVLDYFGVKKDEVVVLEVNNKIYIKRVIGVPGDTIRFTKEGDTYLNNNLVTWNFETKGITRSIDEEITLDHQFYYVLGDNRDIAYDSRTFGKVSKSQILGVVVNINNSK